MFTPEPGKKYEVELAGYSQGTFPLRLIATNVPIIFQQPISQTAPVGGSVVFFVSAGGVLPLSYQWIQNGVVLPGQTGPMLGLTNLTASAIGSYSVIVSNLSGGSVTSETAALMLADDSFRPRLSVAAGSDVHNLQVTLEGETGRCYRIESSTNLSNWSPWQFFPSDRLMSASPFTSVIFSPNSSLSFSLTNDAVTRFFRATPYVAVNNECNFNLKRIRLAKQLWARDHSVDPFFTPVDTDWVPYLTGGNKPRCPSGGLYSPNPCAVFPECSARGHVLEEPR